MGNFQSSTVEQVTSVVNRAATSLVVSKTSQGAATSINTNNLHVTIGEKGEVKNCTTMFNQKNYSNQTVKVMVKFTDLNDMQTQLKTALQNAAEQANKSEQEALATALSVQDNVTSIKQAISNYIDVNVKDEAFSSVNGWIEQVNKFEYPINGKIDCSQGGSLTVNQENVSQQTVELLVDAIIQNNLHVSDDTTADNNTKQTNDSDQKGIFSGLSQLFSGPIMMIIIGIVVVIIILAILAYVFKGTISKVAEKKAGVSFGRSIRKLFN